MSMDGYLTDREEREERAQAQANRDASARAWMERSQPPEVRLLAFDEWLYIQLAADLDWTWAGALKEKRINQCRIQINGLIVELWRRGWLLNGVRLAARILVMLDCIAKAQRAGEVRDFWPYFKASCQRYVGLNAEEIQAEAMAAGTAVGAIFQQLARRLPAGPALPELVAQRADETLRAKLTRQRAQEARKAAEKDQLPLL